MTVYDLDTPRIPASGGVFARVRPWLGKAMRHMQHAQMIRAMSALTDQQLAAMGMTRADIPRRARACIYDVSA